MAPKPKVIDSPKAGLWRVGRSPDPLRFSDPLEPSLLENRTAGNRFDSPTGDYRVCYFATTPDGCFGETLSRFRPDPRLSAIAHEEGFMALGEIPADWRHRRLAVRAQPAPGETIPTIRFLDVEAAETRAVLRQELGELLAFYGYSDLDVPTIRGVDRRVTRWIGRWAYEQRDSEDRLQFAGIRYLSRLSSEWECWALFEGVPLIEHERRPISRENEALVRIANLYELTVF
ncbi:MAG TPA: RES family NAD+ phosphorylase [Solirubrobacteraceae bacterium]|nr:RES family NAD+ phosphorylase [Solirubrobacteraceae bacterium]